jgi:hypothetical protein
VNRIRCCLALVALLVLPAAARAQTFGQFSGAQTLEVNHRLFGAYVQSSENVLGLLGQLRLSFYPAVDFGFQGGFVRHDFGTGHRTALQLGGDLKYMILQEGPQNQYSLAVDGGLGVQTGDHFSVLSLGPNVVASKTFAGNTTVAFTPFASAGLLFSNINVNSDNSSDVSVPLRLGSELQFSGQLALTAELQLRLSDDFNDDVGFDIGVNSPF